MASCLQHAGLRWLLEVPTVPCSQPCLFGETEPRTPWEEGCQLCLLSVFGHLSSFSRYRAEVHLHFTFDPTKSRGSSLCFLFSCLKRLITRASRVINLPYFTFVHLWELCLQPAEWRSQQHPKQPSHICLQSSDHTFNWCELHYFLWWTYDRFLIVQTRHGKEQNLKRITNTPIF